MLIQCQSEYMGEKCETLDVLSSFHLEHIYFHCFIGGSFGLDNLLINSSELICSSELTLQKRNSIFLRFWLSTRFSSCLKMKSVENNLGYIREAISLKKIFEIVQENTLKCSKLIHF